MTLPMVGRVANDVMITTETHLQPEVYVEVVVLES